MNNLDSSGRLNGKVALDTGGTSGIGKATVRVFLHEGANVVLAGRRQTLGQTLDNEFRTIGSKIRYVESDHTNPENCARSVQTAVNEYGGIDILFNNAGSSSMARLKIRLMRIGNLPKTWLESPRLQIPS